MMPILLKWHLILIHLIFRRENMMIAVLLAWLKRTKPDYWQAGGQGCNPFLRALSILITWISKTHSWLSHLVIACTACETVWLVQPPFSFIQLEIFYGTEHTHQPKRIKAGNKNGLKYDPFKVASHGLSFFFKYSTHFGVCPCA